MVKLHFHGQSCWTFDDGSHRVLIDPFLRDNPLADVKPEDVKEIDAILLTHGHFDHVGAAAAVQDACGLPLRCHPDDMEMIRLMPEIQAGYGFPGTPVPRCVTDLEDGATVPFAGGHLEVLHVPGHSPGQIMLVLPGHAVVGDCLFAGSIGRTDLPGGDFEVLEKSIRERIYTLPDDTVVVPGHGPNTTVGREKATNPFVRA